MTNWHLQITNILHVFIYRDVCFSGVYFKSRNDVLASNTWQSIFIMSCCWCWYLYFPFLRYTTVVWVPLPWDEVALLPICCKIKIVPVLIVTTRKYEKKKACLLSKSLFDRHKLLVLVLYYFYWMPLYTFRVKYFTWYPLHIFYMMSLIESESLHLCLWRD